MVNEQRQAGAIEELLLAENKRLIEENERLLEVLAETALNLSSLKEEVGVPLRRLEVHLKSRL